MFFDNQKNVRFLSRLTDTILLLNLDSLFEA